MKCYSVCCVPLVEQELLTTPESLNSSPSFMWFSCCSIFSFLCSILLTVICLVILFWSLDVLVIGLTILLWIVASDFHFGMFKPFLCYYIMFCTVTAICQRHFGIHWQLSNYVTNLTEENLPNESILTHKYELLYYIYVSLWQIFC